MGPLPELTQLLKELIQVGIALTSERDLATLLRRILSEARRFTRAEAGMLFLQDGQHLRLAVCENEPVARRLGDEEMRRRGQPAPLPISPKSLSGYVALTGEVLNIADAYGIPASAPYAFDDSLDRKLGYRTQSVLLVPLRNPSEHVMGVLALINALDDDDDHVIPFHLGYETLVRSLASQAAVAIQNVQLQELSFKDALTGVYNRRYFTLRLEEEVRRHARSQEPVSVILIDIDQFKQINDTNGHGAGDKALLEVAGQLLTRYSRRSTVISRYGGDEFAVLLTNTSKTGAVAYARRIQVVLAKHAFAHGQLTVSIGVASLPDDVADGEDLMRTADGALYEAKRAGGNRVAAA
jgi:diguanylate cyclase (GGDEF)-like protein